MENYRQDLLYIFIDKCKWEALYDDQDVHDIDYFECGHF